MEPEKPQRRVASVQWGGVDLASLLDQVGLNRDATFLWSFGADSGDFQGEYVPAFAKDLPIARLRAGAVLLAYEVNGQPLPRDHGGPVRLFVPGYYGTNSVKWLVRMEARDRRADSLFTTKYYNDRDPNRPGATRPVWEIAPEAVIVDPRPTDEVFGSVRVFGRAWGGVPITGVEVSVDGGTTWAPAKVTPRREWAWQSFSFDWRPKGQGTVTLMCRATDATGATQPMSGARNAVHSVKVTVA